MRDESLDYSILVTADRLPRAGRVRIQGTSLTVDEPVVAVMAGSGTAECVPGVVLESLPNRVRTSVPVQSGESGSPVFDRTGALVGIILARGEGNQGSVLLPAARFAKQLLDAVRTHAADA